MRRIIYQSTASANIDRAELFRLVYHARVANERSGLNGFLIYANNRFLQALEGETWKLVSTFDKIRRDLRHHHVDIIDERSITVPLFDVWRMRCFDADSGPAALASISKEAAHPVPKTVEDAVLAFFGCERALANQKRISAI
ncbi:BLUF domain-containing protein [Erythrobacter sp. R86502]|uniref:BLUF domain-containing protein n=1 Tax=Erythrobacter sp. R86502 TaxID=3093846 RepID=UPI0036D393D7